ncbi:hypothetical protein [Burkholderia sp. BCC0322]|uniref:hypothetical protein n=1 Tax=unclassified Burkholderia TaxID=2613784 RepID=UPI00158B30FC|nr:hypothetical protein [Burkholderia sp. BCC0322]
MADLLKMDEHMRLEWTRKRNQGGRGQRIPQVAVDDEQQSRFLNTSATDSTRRQEMCQALLARRRAPTDVDQFFELRMNFQVATLGVMAFANDWTMRESADRRVHAATFRNECGSRRLVLETDRLVTQLQGDH